MFTENVDPCFPKYFFFVFFIYLKLFAKKILMLWNKVRVQYTAGGCMLSELRGSRVCLMDGWQV